MSRPTRFEEFRYLGDKRKQVVYDLETDDAEARRPIDELLASEQFAAFAPDTLAEARNRGYRPHAVGGARRRRLTVRPAGRPGVGSASAAPFRRRLERDVGERRARRERRRVVGQAVEVDPRGAAAVLVVPGHGDRLGERWTRSASTHSGSRFFHSSRDSA